MSCRKKKKKKKLCTADLQAVESLEFRNLLTSDYTVKMEDMGDAIPWVGYKFYIYKFAGLGRYDILLLCTVVCVSDQRFLL